MAIVLGGFWIYTRAAGNSPGAVTVRLEHISLTIATKDVLLWLCELYALILIPYYAMRPGFMSDARKTFTYFSRWISEKARPNLGAEDRRAMLTLVLKLYFVPLMVGFVLTNIDEVMQYWRAVVDDKSGSAYSLRIDTQFYYLLLSILFTIDVVIFASGYMIEIPALDNEIRSVDPTALGWISCLACYPPFNQPGIVLFAWPQASFVDFGTPLAQTLLAYASLAAAAIFVWASVALGFRASNLTNRGIVSRGPYRWVRHPAYTTKNIMAWIVALPALLQNFSQSIVDGLWILTCLIVWTGIYIVRAFTEERHLLMLDNGYAEYMSRVRTRFVPKLL